MYVRVCDSGRRKVSVVRSKENIRAFRRDKRNGPLYEGVCRAGFQCTTIITVNGIIISMIIVVIVIIVVTVIIVIIVIIVVVI